METTTSAQETKNTQETEIHEFNPRETLSVEGVEQLRIRQYETYQQSMKQYAESGDSTSEAAAKAREDVEATIPTYLEAQRLDSADPAYDQYVDALSSTSIFAVPERDWYATWEDEENQIQGQSGRDKVRAAFESITGEPYFAAPKEVTVSTDETNETIETSESEEVVKTAVLDIHTNPKETNEAVDPAVESAAKTVADLRTQMASLSAKRQARIFGDGGEVFSQTQDAYNKAVVALGQMKYSEELKADTLSEDQKSAMVVAYIFTEQAALREESIELMKNSKVSKAIEIFTRGNVAQRVLKGVVLGAGAAVVGAGLGAVIGVAGIGAVGAGVATAAVTAGTRFIRGYAQRDAREGRGLDSLELKNLEEAQEVTNEAAKDSTEKLDYFAASQAYFDQQHEDAINKEQKKRFRSALAGMAGIALGAGIGIYAQAVVDSVYYDGKINTPGGLLAPDANAVSLDTPETAPGVDVYKSFESDGGFAGFEQDPNAVEILPDPNFVIESGEGGISFFQGLGLTEANWYEIDSELLEKFPGDFYPMGDGNVGIAHPGQLSLEAQEFIKDRFALP